MMPRPDLQCGLYAITDGPREGLERARSMACKNVDYISFGAFHTSPTKPHARRVSPQLLAKRPAWVPR